ncbi:hypothetical protein [Erythrobacter longus]|nr:hypothetical protein [Erythrobacter longus]
MRSEHLVIPELFGEPAWDILLHIFYGQSEGREIKIQSIAMSCRLQITSVLRWLEVLERRRLIFAYRKEDSETLKPGQVCLRLSSQGYEAMAQYLERFAWRDPFCDRYRV